MFLLRPCWSFKLSIHWMIVLHILLFCNLKINKSNVIFIEVNRGRDRDLKMSYLWCLSLVYLESPTLAKLLKILVSIVWMDLQSNTKALYIDFTGTANPYRKAFGFLFDQLEWFNNCASQRNSFSALASRQIDMSLTSDVEINTLSCRPSGGRGYLPGIRMTIVGRRVCHPVAESSVEFLARYGWCGWLGYGSWDEGLKLLRWANEMSNAIDRKTRVRKKIRYFCW